MPLRMSGGGYSQEARTHFPRPLPLEDDLRAWLRRQFVSVNNTATAEMLGVTLGIGYIVAVRQKDARDTTEGLQTPNQRCHKLWRIDQPVAGGMANEIA